MKSSRALILASQSPQRRKLLKSLGVPFRIVPANIPEKTREKYPRRIVSGLALRKAAKVAKKYPRALVLGADTIVICRGKTLLKPQNKKDSLKMLKTLNGRWHRVYTGVALIDTESGRCWWEVTVSRVKARVLEPEDLKRLAGKHLDKAGGYAMQDQQDPFIEKVIGPVDNVIGLPLASVRNLLRKAAANKMSPR